MSSLRAIAIVLAGASVAACNPPPLEGKGGPCHSLTDCKPDLVCDEGTCTGDLSRLARQTEDPPFLALQDAGSDAGSDASSDVPDAAVLGDAGAGAVSDAGAGAVSDAGADASSGDGG